MVNRILKDEIRIYARLRCNSEVRRCLGQVVKTRGFRRTQTLLEKIFRHPPNHSEELRLASLQGRAFALNVLETMDSERRAKGLKTNSPNDALEIPANAQLQGV